MRTSLLPLTLSLSSLDPRHQKANRERLALKAIDLENLSDDEELASFSALISDEWLFNHDKRIGAIRDLWQETQRIAIGSSYDLISARLSNEQREIVGRMVKLNGQEVGPLLSDYVANLLDRLSVPVGAGDCLGDCGERFVSPPIHCKSIVQNPHGMGRVLPLPDQLCAGFDLDAAENAGTIAIANAIAISRSRRFVAADRPP
jgi:hypothetical protein